MKKLISTALTAATLLTCMSMTAITASAETDYKGVKLPFTVEAPANVAIEWMNENDSPTTTLLTYSVNNDLNKWMVECADPESHDAAMERLLKDYGLTDVYINAQVDWAIDDPVNGWHYTKYWDGEIYTDEDGNKTWTSFGKDRDYNTRVGDWDLIEEGVSTDIVTDEWIMRGVYVHNDPAWTEEEKVQNNEVWYGTELIPGLKDQLKEGQYTLIEVDAESHEQMVKIDYTQHTAYVRVRLAVSACKDGFVDEVIFSDWSETASYGKDAAPETPLPTKETLAPPVITNLRYYQDEFNGYPQIAVTLDVPEDLTQAVAAVQSKGKALWIEWEARVPGGTWVGLQGGWTIMAGEQVIALQNLAEELKRENSENGVSNPDIILAKDSPVELRARYVCDQYNPDTKEFDGEFRTDYSEVLTFGTQEMSSYDQPSAAESSTPDASTVSKAEVSKADESKTEVSKAEVSKADESKTEVSKADESKTEVSKAEEKKGGFPIWIIILIIAIVLIIIIIIIIIVVAKKKKDDDNNNTTAPANKQ